MALKRRMKLIQKGWRNGVVGVEGPDDQQHFEDLEGKQSQPLFTNHRQDIDNFNMRQQYRSERLRYMNGTSSQITFCQSKFNCRNEPEKHRAAEAMVMKPVRTGDRATSVKIKVTDDKQAKMNARTEGGTVEIATGWKSR